MPLIGVYGVPPPPPHVALLRYWWNKSITQKYLQYLQEWMFTKMSLIEINNFNTMMIKTLQFNYRFTLKGEIQNSLNFISEEK